MTTPLSLRLARLLLAGAAAGSVGCMVVIVSRAQTLAPLTLAFTVPAALFAAAALRLGDAPGPARRLALAAAVSLAALGALAGWGAGDLTFPFASLGVVAAWAAHLHPPRRPVVIAFGAYLLIGLVLLALRPTGLVPFALATVLLWPLMAPIFTGGSLPMTVIVAFGAAVALLARATVSGGPKRSGTVPLSLLGGLIAGTGVVVTLLAYAAARRDTSLRYELEPVALAIVFAGAALLAFGLGAMRATPALGFAAVLVGASLTLPLALARPTVECQPNGVATSLGPWWWRSVDQPSTVAVSGGLSAGDGSRSASGRIDRDDTVITYRCAGGQLVEFRSATRGAP